MSLRAFEKSNYGVCMTSVCSLNIPQRNWPSWASVSTDIVQTLIDQNVVLPGGLFDVAGENLIIEPSGNFRSVEDIENLLIAVPGTQQSIFLKDLLNVRRGFAEPPKDLAFFNGERAIVISLSVIPGVNAVAFGEHLKDKVDDLQSHLPIGYALDFATFQPDLVQKAVGGALTECLPDPGHCAGGGGCLPWFANRFDRRLLCTDDHAARPDRHAVCRG